MAQKQTVADRIMGKTSMMTRMASAEASDAGLCPRCSGFMVQERFDDFPGGVAGLPFQGVRCVNCGEILDLLILEHRNQRPQPVNNRRRFHQQL
ncbi:MAG TPA: hypothetical protein VGQ07_07135 [Nitrospirales bacterium]|nr:hypothetical protein [Nitrospirales bacterium]